MAKMAASSWDRAMAEARRIAVRYGRRTAVRGLRLWGRWEYVIEWAEPW